MEPHRPSPPSLLPAPYTSSHCGPRYLFQTPTTTSASQWTEPHCRSHSWPAAAFTSSWASPSRPLDHPLSFLSSGSFQLISFTWMMYLWLPAVLRHPPLRLPRPHQPLHPPSRHRLPLHPPPPLRQPPLRHRHRSACHRPPTSGPTSAPIATLHAQPSPKFAPAAAWPSSTMR